ncbi:inactive tyrosine-protein kinase 7-like [Diorhabda sublineata]|uniref:inactive tyrosine-protein kinase 7-like n=1 Tax=Diorhabda sublineata TaxID=1163346 RepID=UPI0024E0CED9|nr:inactive tyrosine-protein kinase 7-like [Diorhabda sublineata]
MFILISALLMCLLCGVVQGKEEPYFVKTPKDVDVVTGNSVTLQCEVTPDSGMRYYWELNGSKIANTTRRHQQGSNLHITRVDREKDSGQFTCIAEDTTGQATAITSSPATINIQCQPLYQSLTQPAKGPLYVQIEKTAFASFSRPGLTYSSLVQENNSIVDRFLSRSSN